MTIAGRFEAELEAVDGPELGGPELLPVRLSLACTRVLGVDGAGISMSSGGRRIPLGASSEAAMLAERLQFTAGDGPCMAAQRSREPVFAPLAELRRRWPAFADLLVERSPYRAVVALPLREAISGLGAIDLYFGRDEGVPELDVFEAMAVGDLVTSTLSETAVWSTWSPAQGPDWLHGPAARRRGEVWEAMGRVALALDGDALAALALLRARAYGAGRTVDDVAHDLLAGRLRVTDLHGAAS